MISQTHETIHEGTKSPLILHWIILSPEKSVSFLDNLKKMHSKARI